MNRYFQSSRPRNALALAALLAGVAAAHATTPDIAAILAALRSAHPGTAFSAVNPTPLTGVYEVVMGENIAYVTAHDTRYLVFGRLYDTRLGRDVSGQSGPGGTGSMARRAAPPVVQPSPPSALRLADLPLDDALKAVQGNGKRVIVVFSDPRCHYCRQLDAILATLGDVTVHTFIVPFQDPELGRAIWCAPDRAAAWRQAMLGQSVARKANACIDPIERNLALASRMNVRGTPSMLFADGRRLDGLSQAPEIEAYLSNPLTQVRP